MNHPSSRGFSLIELSFVILLFGIVFAMSVPAYNTYRATNELKSATQTVASQLKLAREKAIATGTMQTFHVNPGVYGADFHMHLGNNVAPLGATWTLPKSVTFDLAATYWEYTMLRDGRCSNSGLIVLQNARGLKDTVSVQVSGLVLVQ